MKPRKYHWYCAWCHNDWDTDDFRYGPCPCCDHETVREIMVHHVFPPIPRRDFDYRAYFDGEEENGQYGYGPDVNTAISDLIAEYGEAG